MSVRTSIGQADLDGRFPATDRRKATAPKPIVAPPSQGVSPKPHDGLASAITVLARLLARQAAAEFVAAQDMDLPQ